MDPETIQIIVSFLIGIFSGTLAGTFGIGGATVAIPLMRLLLGMDAHVVIGTALPLTIPAALAGATTYFYKGKKPLRWKTILACGIAGSIVAVLAAYASGQAPSVLLMGALGLVLVGLAILVYWGRDRKSAEGEDSLLGKAWKTVLIGGIAGFACGFFGIGGGVILVPLLMLIRGIEYRQAVASSLAIILIYAVPAAATHYSLGNFDLPTFVAMFIGASIGGWQGAKFALGRNEKELRKWFSALLAVLGIILVANEAYIAFS